MKRKLYLFLISAALFASSSLRADITSNLLLHYTFDNVAGGVVPDASGHSMDGTLVGAATTGVGYGASGNSVSLTAVDDYVQLPNDVTTTLTDYTVACWVNLTTINYWGRIFDFGNGTAINMFMAPQDGKPYYAIKQSDEVGEQSVKSTAAITAGTWSHVALTCKFDETTGVGTMTIYINGSPAGVKQNITTTPASMGTTPQNYIGKSQYPDPTINGLIDDFRVYSRALTTEDIMVLKGIPVALITEFQSLSIAGDLTAVTGNLTLPVPTASNVTIAWTSTDSALVSPTGVVARPAKFKASATLTAILTIDVEGVKTVLTKSFVIMVNPVQEVSETVALWNFADADIITNVDGTVSVKDQSDNAYVAKCEGGAQIVKIGDTKQFNVLSIKNSGQYFDFGTPIGEAIYGLTDYTVSMFFRRDTTIDHITNWTGYGKPLYGFSNTLLMGSEATGGMYFEPLRGRQVCTPDNYGSEGSNFVGVGTNRTPLGTWHNVCYSQIAGVGHLYFDGVEVATGPMQAPAVTLKKSGKTGTIYNSIGRPFYNGDPWLTNTLVYGFNMYSVGLTTDDLPSILNITNTITELDAAFNATSYNVYTYADMAAILANAKKAKLSNYVPGLVALNASIDSSQVAYDAKAPTTELNTNLTAAIAVYNAAQAPWMELGKLIPTTVPQVALNYPGLSAFQTAIAAAQTAYNAYTVTAQTIADLNAAVKAYLITKPASLDKPMNYTFNIVNPSFEEGAGGTKDTLSVAPGGSYNYPKGWTVYVNHSDWCNAAFISDAPSDGIRCFETWAAVINEFDVYQSVDLPAGNYILSAQIRTNAAAPFTQHIYAKTAAQTFVSGTLKDTMIGNWNSFTNWQTVYCVFSTTGGPTRIGFNSNGFMQFDNMKLTYTGSDVPAQVNLTSFIANPSFEEATTPGVDASSIKAAGGGYQTPNGWNAYCNVNPAAGWCAVVPITGGVVNGTKAFEMWCDSIISFRMSQKIVAPASGFYTLTADARCDASSPNDNDPFKYDARVFATSGKKATKYSAKLGQQVVNTGAGWNNAEAWRKLSVNFEANVGDSVNIGIMSASFMQLDNFTLTYLVNANPAVSLAAPKKAAGISVELSPNPTSDILNIKGLDAMSTVKIFNITGQRVYEGRANSDIFSVDCSKYSQGMYLLQVESQGKSVNTKFIKK